MPAAAPSPAAVLARLPKVSDVIKAYGLVAKSQLSQNFILDMNVTDKIVGMVQPNRKLPDLRNSLVIEVGPGPGMLTRSLIKAGANKIIAVEKDSRFLPLLSQLTDATNGAFRVVHGDILATDGADLLAQAARDLNHDPTTEPVHLVGNLPFNIATPLLIAQLRAMADKSGLFSAPAGTDMTLMFQREVAERMIAPTGGNKRSRLSVVVQAVSGAELAGIVPRSVFVPRPAVDAAVVRFVPRAGAFPVPGGMLALETVARGVFGQRRKTIRNNLRATYGDEDVADALMERVGINPGSRPQDLSTAQVVRLAVAVHEMGLTSSTGSVVTDGED
ncbi:S-adenosyl-L-methionine-dependent methyltransferase [Blastocladiella britannica]|nr:S-adenosyl-L-methionine-dependent methyltransferase [Blastocladiella britannica]